ncbi:T9SS type A sorting domain-containing protein [Hymenobacter sp. BT175]|uniref:T9SS type A sorting domain-containing protein n=1 Tax=Hymenobacter translucens TaxID=2886507 RepID=UPI001D0E46D0|nr:T9SS type A sorting domain-containing protein [Hymenobacter translucens]MCC2547266.1 T9SS type A sorting domain-containing protein [Hymenobacter translucens]
MKKTSTLVASLFLAALGLASATSARAQTANYLPLAVTGFNQDVVANGAGAVTASTTADVDGGALNNRFTFMAPSFVSPTGAVPTTFLPASGLISSAATPGLTFQLAPYTASNTLRLADINSGVLTVTAPQPARELYLLVTSGNGASTFTVTVGYTDNSSDVFAGQSAADWFGGSGFAIQGIGRVNRDNNAITNSTSDPRLYQLRLILPLTSQVKTIRTITINKTVATGVLNVMAATINAVPLSTRPARADFGLHAYPSPATDVLTVRAQQPAAGPAWVRLLDLDGRLLQVQTVQGGRASFRCESLPAGLYLVQYQAGSQSQTLRVVKQ